jgi:hypothetical protein
MQRTVRQPKLDIVRSTRTKSRIAMAKYKSLPASEAGNDAEGFGAKPGMKESLNLVNGVKAN